MRKALIIHHFETRWRAGIKRESGYSLEYWAAKIISHIVHGNYDFVLLNRDEGIGPEEFHIENGFHRHVDQWSEYSYCFERSAVLDEDGNLKDGWIPGGEHSEVLPIPEWAEKIQEFDRVDLIGAFSGECIEDMEILLTYLVPRRWRKIKSLII